MPKVSICIPAYNDVDGIQRLLNSIKIQTFKDFDIIISDDTRNDTVKNLLNDYNDLPINYVEGTHIRACENWNRSIELADGQYIKIMHQDDWFTGPDSLAEFVSMLDDDPSAIMAFCGSRQVTIHKDDPFNISDYYDRCISDDNLKNFEKDYRDLYNGDWVGAPSAIIYRSCQARFDPELTWIIDIDFYMNLLKSGKGFVCSKKPLVSIGVSDTQLTNSCINDGDLNIREYSHVMRKYGLSEYPVYRRRLCNIAVLYKKKYADIKDLGIPKEEYTEELHKRKAYLRDFYKKLIIKKLFNRK